jgi:hypothetical protein
VANAIPKATVTAKGDVIVATGASTVTNLAVGADGTTLVADSSTSTGLRYQSPYSQQPTLNSAFQVWQRGTSPTWIANNSGNYQADRWLGFSVAAGRTVTRQLTGDTTNLPNVQYCARVQRTAANTATDTIQLLQIFESVNSIPFAGKTVTFSFYARKGANYSATSSVLQGVVTTGTGTDENYIYPGFSGGTNPIIGSATLTTNWQRFTFSGTLATSATQIALRFQFDPTGTAGAADYFEVTGVQLELGSVATPFHTYAGTLQGELTACQRYFEIVSPTEIGGGGAYCTGYANSTTNARFVLQYLVTKRTAPTIAFSGNFFVQNVTNITVTATGTYTIGTRSFWFFATATGLVANSALALVDNTGSIAISAEL